MYLIVKFEMTEGWHLLAICYIIVTLMFFVMKSKQALKSLRSISFETKRSSAIECWFTRAFIIIRDVM